MLSFGWLSPYVGKGAAGGLSGLSMRLGTGEKFWILWGFGIPV